VHHDACRQVVEQFVELAPERGWVGGGHGITLPCVSHQFCHLPPVRGDLLRAPPGSRTRLSAIK
jgi:hypothetical protein